MKAGNLNSIVRRAGLLAVTAFSMLFTLVGRLNAAPAVYAHAASHFTIADFDGDNRPDFASVNAGQSSLQTTRYWIAFQLSGRSGQTVSLMAPDGGLRITARDVNGDNFLDVVVTTLWTNKPVAILLNDGLGNFTAANPSEFRGAFAVPATSCTSAAAEIRDATALPYSRPIPGDRGEGNASFSRRSLSRLFSPNSCPDSIASRLSPFAGRAPPRL
jgi:FG-GAP-like repeat